VTDPCLPFIDCLDPLSTRIDLLSIRVDPLLPRVGRD